MQCQDGQITIFKIGKLWVFKYFFEIKEIFKALLDYYNQDLYSLELKTLGERNKALKILVQNRFDYILVDDLIGYVVKFPKFAKYAQIFESLVASGSLLARGCS